MGRFVHQECDDAGALVPVQRVTQSEASKMVDRPAVTVLLGCPNVSLSSQASAKLLNTEIWGQARHGNPAMSLRDACCDHRTEVQLGHHLKTFDN